MSNIIQQIRDAYTENPAKAFDRLPELFKAVDDGKIVELPCKVGDTVWSSSWSDEPEPYSVKYFDYADQHEQLFHALNEDETQWEDFNSKEIGKTVFLTRESAEAALKKENESK